MLRPKEVASVGPKMKAGASFAPKDDTGVSSDIHQPGRVRKKKQYPDGGKVSPMDSGLKAVILGFKPFGKKKQEEPDVKNVAPKGPGIVGVILGTGRFGQKKQHGTNKNLGNVACGRSATQSKNGSNGTKSGPLSSSEQGLQAGQAAPALLAPKDPRPFSPHADGTNKAISRTSDGTDSDFSTYLKRRLSALRKEEPFVAPAADVESWLSALRTRAFRNSMALKYNTTDLAANATTAALTVTSRTRRLVSYIEIVFDVFDPGTKKGRSKTTLSRYIRALDLEIIIEGSLARIWGEKEAVDDASEAIGQLSRISRGPEVAVRWYWAQDNTSDDVPLLRAMRAETSDLLEEAFGRRDIVRYTVKGNKYEADFTRMQQTNIQTGTSHQIRRVASERQGSPLPRNPEAIATSPAHLEGIAYKLIKIGGEELKIVKAAVRKTQPYPVTRVDQISNPFLWGHFVQNAKVIQNERDLFHGAKSESIPNICTMGFDKRLAGSRNGAMYGKGCYFTQNAGVAARYMDSPNRGQMIMAKVLVGRFTQGRKHMVRPPLIGDSDGHRSFDSTVDNVAQPKTFVTYMDWQAYPMYLITFG